MSERAEPRQPAEAREVELLHEAQDLLNLGYNLSVEDLRQATATGSARLDEALCAMEALHDAVPSAAAPVLQPGDRLGGCEIRGVIGRGGMGIVYDALEERSGRPVALKVLSPALVGDATALLRFKRESDLMREIRHPNVVEVYGAGEEDGLFYYLMERVAGESLAAHLEQCTTRADTGSCRAWARRFVGLAEALDLAHRAGVIHRDVKPSNVLVASGGRLRLTDFGIARAERLKTLTATSAVLGTPLYMAPEQALGKRRSVGPPTDVYGLAATLYEVVAGRPLFDPEGGRTSLLEEILHRMPRAPRRLNRSVPRSLEAVLLRSLEKRPGERYPTAGALAADLARVAAGESVRVSPGSRVRRLARRAGPRRALTAVLAVVVVVVALVVSHRAPRPRPPAPSWGVLRSDAWLRLFAGRGSPGLAAVERQLEALGPLPPAAEDERTVLRSLLANKRGAHERALELLAEPARLRSRKAAHVIRGFAHRGAWRYTEAVDEDRRAEALPFATRLDRVVWVLHLLRHAGRRKEARALATELVAAHPESLPIRVVLADLSKELGEYPAALDACGTLLMMRPGDPDVLVLRGEIRRRAGQKEAAEQDFRAALVKDPGAFYTRFALYNLLAAEGVPGRRQALHVIEEGLARQPDSAELLTLRGWHHQSGGEPARALADYRAALQADPCYHRAQVNLGNLLFEMGRDREALAAWGAMLDDPQQPRQNVASLLNNRAVYKWKHTDRAGAIADLRRALKTCFHPTAKGNLALFLVDEARFGDARRELDELLVRTPADPEALARRAFCRLACYDASGARRDLDRARELFGKRTPGWVWEKVASVAWLLGDRRQAEEAARQAVRLSREPSVLADGAALFVELGRLDEAERLADRLGSLPFARAQAHWLAWLRVRLRARRDGWERAVETWQTSVLPGRPARLLDGCFELLRAIVGGASGPDGLYAATCRALLEGREVDPKPLLELPVPADGHRARVIGEALLAAGQPAAAVAPLEAATTLGHGACRATLAAALLKVGRTAPGLEALRQALAGDLPQLHAVWTLQGAGVPSTPAIRHVFETRSAPRRP